MDVIRKFFRKHSLKLVSLGISILLWIVATNSYQPRKLKYYYVNISLLNEEALENNGYILANREEILNKKVQVGLKITEREIQNLENMETQVTAEIDLKPIDLLVANGGPEYAVNVIYKLPSDYKEELIFHTPTKSVDIILDTLAKKTLPVTIVETGETDPGYIKSKSKVTPDTITFSGAKSIVDKVASVTVEISLTDKQVDFSTNKPVILFDGNGKDITDSLKIDRQIVKVETTIYKIGKVLINPPTYTGNLPAGYEIVNVTVEPEFIEVVGEESNIVEFPNIDLSTVDITGKTETFSEVFDLSNILKESQVKLSYDDDLIVTATFEIEKIETRQFSLPVSNIKFISDDRYPYEYETEIVSFILEGTKGNLDKVIVGEIPAKIDISDLEVGSHTIIPVLELPDNLKLVGTPSAVAVNIYTDHVDEVEPPSENVPEQVQDIDNQ